MVSNAPALDFPRLAVDQLLPRSLVHKQNADNVLLTAMGAPDKGHYVCMGRIPQAPAFYNDAGRVPGADAVFLTELGRQASLAVSHQFLDVPHDHAFVLDFTETKVLIEAKERETRRESDFIAVEIHLDDVVRRKGDQVSHVDARFSLHDSVSQIVSGAGSWSVHPLPIYKRIRRMSRNGTTNHEGAFAPPLPASPSVLGHEHPRNVVVSSPEPKADDLYVSMLSAHPRHEFFFDHPRDHLPGLLLCEAAAQTSLLTVIRNLELPASDLMVKSLCCNFDHFVEHGAAVEFSARWNGTTDAAGHAFLEVTVAQSGNDLGRIDVCVART